MARSSTSTRGSRDKQSLLRGLAGELGYDVDHALRRDGWHILDKKGARVEAPPGKVTFTIDEALAVLRDIQPKKKPKR